MAALGAIACAAAVGGCGSQSPEDYRASLDDACVQLADSIDRIPERVRDDDLDPEEATALAEEAGDEFAFSVADLDLPGELADDHARLEDKTESEPPAGDIDALIEYTEDFGDIYDSLGAEACSRFQDEAVERLSAGV